MANNDAPSEGQGAAPEPRLTYSVREAAAILGVGAPTLYRAIEREEVPAIRIGRCRVIPKRWVITDRAGLATIDNPVSL
jgi:excisionase family DNA binding protein